MKNQRAIICYLWKKNNGREISDELMQEFLDSALSYHTLSRRAQDSAWISALILNVVAD